MDTNENRKGRPKREKSPFGKIFCELIGNESQGEIASKIGVARQSIQKWIAGETSPDIVTLGKIANAYNVSTDYLLGRSKSRSLEYNPTTESLLRELLAICKTLNLRTELAPINSSEYNPEGELCFKMATNNEIICSFMQDYLKIKPLLNDETYPEYIRSGLIPSLIAKYKDHPVEKLKNNTIRNGKI